MSDIIKKILSLNPCNDAREWLDAHPATDPKALWRECDRGDWLIWLVIRAGGDLRRALRVVCRIVRPVLRFMPSTKTQPLRVIELIESWCRGENVTSQQLRDAASAYFAANAAANAAAYSAAFAANAAANAAAYSAAFAAYAAANAAANAAAYSASFAAHAVFAAADANAAAYSASFAAHAVFAAADANAAANAAAASRTHILKVAADLVRAEFHWSEIEALLEAL